MQGYWNDPEATAERLRAGALAVGARAGDRRPVPHRRGGLPVLRRPPRRHHQVARREGRPARGRGGAAHASPGVREAAVVGVPTSCSARRSTPTSRPQQGAELDPATLRAALRRAPRGLHGPASASSSTTSCRGPATARSTARPCASTEPSPALRRTSRSRRHAREPVRSERPCGARAKPAGWGGWARTPHSRPAKRRVANYPRDRGVNSPLDRRLAASVEFVTRGLRQPLPDRHLHQPTASARGLTDAGRRCVACGRDGEADRDPPRRLAARAGGGRHRRRRGGGDRPPARPRRARDRGRRRAPRPRRRAARRGGDRDRDRAQRGARRPRTRCG